MYVKLVIGKQIVNIVSAYTMILGGGREMRKRWLPNEMYITKPDKNLNLLKTNIL